MANWVLTLQRVTRWSETKLIFLLTHLTLTLATRVSLYLMMMTGKTLRYLMMLVITQLVWLLCAACTCSLLCARITTEVEQAVGWPSPVTRALHLILTTSAGQHWRKYMNLWSPLIWITWYSGPSSRTFTTTLVLEVGWFDLNWSVYERYKQEIIEMTSWDRTMATASPVSVFTVMMLSVFMVHFTTNSREYFNLNNKYFCL